MKVLAADLMMILKQDRIKKKASRDDISNRDALFMILF